MELEMFTGTAVGKPFHCIIIIKLEHQALLQKVVAVSWALASV